MNKNTIAIAAVAIIIILIFSTNISNINNRDNTFATSTTTQTSTVASSSTSTTLSQTSSSQIRLTALGALPSSCINIVPSGTNIGSVTGLVSCPQLSGSILQSILAVIQPSTDGGSSSPQLTSHASLMIGYVPASTQTFFASLTVPQLSSATGLQQVALSTYVLISSATGSTSGEMGSTISMSQNTCQYPQTSCGMSWTVSAFIVDRSTTTFVSTSLARVSSGDQIQTSIVLANGLWSLGVIDITQGNTYGLTVTASGSFAVPNTVIEQLQLDMKSYQVTSCSQYPSNSATWNQITTKNMQAFITNVSPTVGCGESVSQNFQYNSNSPVSIVFQK